MWIDDDILRQCAGDLTLSCWQPDRPAVVLGSSNAASVEADPDVCKRDSVEILKRYGGGGTVVLHPGCAVVSLGLWVRQHFQNGFYFNLLNRAVIATLARSWPELACLGQDGVSDIVMRDKKVAGTSLFRSRNYLLYQASLLVHPHVELIERYLKHPSREPTYRSGRDHRSFLTGLAELVPGLSPATVVAKLSAELENDLRSLLHDELLPSQQAQHATLLRRADGAYSSPA